MPAGLSRSRSIVLSGEPPPSNDIKQKEPRIAHHAGAFFLNHCFKDPNEWYKNTFSSPSKKQPP